MAPWTGTKEPSELPRGLRQGATPPRRKSQTHTYTLSLSLSLSLLQKHIHGWHLRRIRSHRDWPGALDRVHPPPVGDGKVEQARLARGGAPLRVLPGFYRALECTIVNIVNAGPR